MKTVIELAKESGFTADEFAWHDYMFERLVELARADAIADEREACAKVCDAMEEKAEGTECCKWPTPIDCAHAIRARSET